MKMLTTNLGQHGAVQAFFAGNIKFDTEGAAEGVKLCDIPEGLVILKAVAVVNTGFNAATTNVLTVGFEGTKKELLDTADITEGTPGTYCKDMFLMANKNNAIFAKYTQSGSAASTGDADIYIVAVPGPVE